MRSDLKKSGKTKQPKRKITNSSPPQNTNQIALQKQENVLI